MDTFEPKIKYVFFLKDKIRFVRLEQYGCYTPWSIQCALES